MIAVVDFFRRKILDVQQELARELENDSLPQTLVRMIGQLMAVDHVLLLKVDGEFLGPQAEQTEGWKVKSYSLNVIRDAIRSECGYSKGGKIEGNPTESQRAGNIHSCIAARVNAGEKTIAAIHCDVRNEDRRFSPEDGVRLKMIAVTDSSAATPRGN